jgi:hypothetical protein
MRTAVVILGLLVSSGGVAGAQDPIAFDAATEKLLIQNEHALYDAVAKADRERFQALVLPQGIWTTPSSFIPMGPLADGLRSFELPNWAIENPHVVWADGNAALLLYVRTGGGNFDHRPLAQTTLASTLWTKRSGKWVAVHHQESGVQ